MQPTTTNSDAPQESEIPPGANELSTILMAGLLLAARLFLQKLALPHPSVDAILTATGAGRTRAYALRDSILRALPSLQRTPGRPGSAPVVVSSSQETPTELVLDFIVAHPGCIERGARRQHYSEDFKCFIVELREQWRAMELPSFADAVHVPLGTLEDWLRVDLTAASQSAKLASKPEGRDVVTSTRMQTVIDAWKQWQGSFTNFCKHVKENLRIPYGRTFISSILELSGVRRRRRRSGRSPDEKALRGAFETFFPGAQWVGDGSPVTVRLTMDGEEHELGFNLELMTDARTGAFVGISVRDEEDSQAVTEAFSDGVEATGASPLAVLLDNRPSNHTDEVDKGMGETLRIRATRGRAQNKAHVEGAFGLFKSTAPPLDISADTPRELAARVLELIVQTWARTLNHRPRTNRDGLSRVELYDQPGPTPEEVEEAHKALQQRQRKQEKAMATLQARQDPVARALLDAAFTRLALLDPDANIRSAIARYPLDAITAGVATFEGKRDADTLPAGVDARYLLGIVRNIAQQDEGVRISKFLLRRRLEARDLALASLESERDRINDSNSDVRGRVESFIENGLRAERTIDHLFWLDATATAIGAAEHTDSERHELFRVATRRVHAAYRLSYERRLSAVRWLARSAVPID
ncbi:MAG: hypothetical protein V3T05_07525 [Myxococcota bacterium]